MRNTKTVLLFALPVLLSFFLHLHVFRLEVIGYHAWRQTQTQTVIYNFSFSGNSILHPQKFDLTDNSAALLYEFPLYQWLVAQVNNCLGYSVVHTRLFSFLVFVLFLLGFYRLLRPRVPEPVALMTNALLCFSPLLYYYCVNPLPDTLALCLATWALVFFERFTVSARFVAFLLFTLFLSLAALVKLPYLLFGAAWLPLAYRQLRQKNNARLLQQLSAALLCLLPVGAWYAMAIPTWINNPVTSGLLGGDKTLLQLLDYLRFNLISSVPELLVNYGACIFFFVGTFLFFKRKRWKSPHLSSMLAVVVLLACYFLFELGAIEKTHDYYLMPFIPFLFLLVAYGLLFFYRRGSRPFIILVLALVPLLAFLRIDHRWNLQSPGFPAEYLHRAAHFDSLLPRQALCVIDHDNSRFIALYYLKRQGYSLSENEMSPAVLKDRYHRGARYLVTQDTAFAPAGYPDFDLTRLHRGELSIYQLHLK